LFLPFLPLPAARGIAIWMAMTWNFYWNRRFTFSDRQSDGMSHQYLRFCASSLGGATISWLTSVLLCELSGFIAGYPAIGAAIGIIAGVSFNFAASCRWVFRPNSRSEAPAAVRLATLDNTTVRQTGLNDLPSR
jgi:putative flippase GtrA